MKFCKMTPTKNKRGRGAGRAKNDSRCLAARLGRTLNETTHNICAVKHGKETSQITAALGTPNRRDRRRTAAHLGQPWDELVEPDHQRIRNHRRRWPRVARAGVPAT